MRLNADDFIKLRSASDFADYYDTLNPREMLDELDRLYDMELEALALNQHLGMFRRFADLGCMEGGLKDHQRSSLLGIATGLHESIRSIFLPRVQTDHRERIEAALAGTMEVLDRFGHYPRAVEMIKVGARYSSGPYELGLAGQMLARR